MTDNTDNELLSRTFDPEIFRQRGHSLVDTLTAHLIQAQGRAVRVSPPETPQAKLESWAPATTPGDWDSLLKQLLDGSMQLHHPRYVGHQMAVPAPLAILCELATGFLNNSAAIYEMGPNAVSIERQVIRWMLSVVGFPETGDGVFTSGGSMGNLTALLAAREHQSGRKAWQGGNVAGDAFLVSEQAHYCSDRAVRIMGMGAGGIERVPVDSDFRMDVEKLPAILDSSKKRGKRILGVVASACSTATGSFDPLEPIAAFCESKGLWMHVDGAHGASCLVSRKYRHLLSGIERAHSIVWDPHKMMMVPALCTSVLFQSKRLAAETFNQDASILFPGGDDEEWFNPCRRTLETTKRDYAFRLYALLRCYGEGLIERYVDKTCDLAKRFAEIILADKDFELAVTPQSNIVCFRYRYASGREDAKQLALRKRVNATGNFYLVQATLPTGVYLRTTLMGPFTTEEDLLQLLAEIRHQS